LSTIDYGVFLINHTIKAYKHQYSQCWYEQSLSSWLLRCDTNLFRRHQSFWVYYLWGNEM